MIKELRLEAEEFVHQPILGATISITRLAALYGEDLLDAFDWLGLSYINLPYIQWLGPVAISSTSTAYAGSGRGLCVNYTSPDACLQEERRFPSTWVFAVSYTHTSLSASIARVQTAYIPQDHENNMIADLTLGWDARHDLSDQYWEKVRSTLSFPLATGLHRNVTKVLLTGDAIFEPEFRQILNEVIENGMDIKPEIIDTDPVDAGAKGAAEFGKRVLTCGFCTWLTYQGNGMESEL